MKIERIDNGRFDHAIWVNIHSEDYLTRYGTADFSQMAFSLEKATELRDELTKALLAQSGKNV